ncbi:hypothetical protein JTE90_026366, partial [Oedothorax gibbosus]
VKGSHFSLASAEGSERCATPQWEIENFDLLPEMASEVDASVSCLEGGA